MKKLILKVRDALLWLLLALLLIWIVGSGMFLIFPTVQRTAVRLVLRYFNIPVFVDYTDAHLVPGNFIFVNPLIIYSDKNSSIIASVDTLTVRYSFGNPIVIKELRVINPHIDAKFEKSSGVNVENKNFSVPNILIKRAVVQNGDFKIGDMAIRDFSFEGEISTEDFGSAGGSITFRVDTAGIYMDGRGRIVAMKGSGDYDGKTLNAGLNIVLPGGRIDLKIYKFRLNDQTFDSILARSDGVNLAQVDSILGFGVLNGNASLDISVSRNDNKTTLIGYVDGNLWDIPISLHNGHLTMDESTGIVKLDRGTGKIWGADFEKPEVILYTNSSPVEYEFKLGRIKGFDLTVFDGPHTFLSGAVDIKGSDFGDNMKMTILAKLDRSIFEDFLFDGGKLLVKFDSGDLFFPAGEETSFIFVKNDTVKLTGRVLRDGRLFVSSRVKISSPDTFLARYGYDSLQISGNVKGSVEVIGKNGVVEIKPNLIGRNMDIYGVHLDSLSIVGQIKDLDSQTGNLIILGVNGSFGSVSIDTLNIVLRSGNNKYFFRPFKLVSSYGAVRATGYINLDKPLGLRIDGLTYDRIAGFSLTEPVFVSFENGISAKNVRFSAVNGFVRVDTLFFSDTLAVLSGKFEGINLSEISDIFAPNAKITGVGKGHFDLAFNPVARRGRGAVDVYLAPVSVGGIAFSSFSAEAKFSADTITITRCFARRPGEDANLSGYVVLGDSVPTVNLNLAATGKTPGFVGDLVEGVVPQAGEYSFVLYARGNANSPSLEGNFNLSGGKFLISPLDDPLDSVQISARIVGSLVQIDKFSGVMSSMPLTSGGVFAKIWNFLVGKKPVRGKITADGMINIGDLKNPSMEIRVMAKNLPLKSTEKGFYFVADGQMDVVSPPLHIIGDLTLRNGTLLKLGSPSPEPTSIPVDLDLALSITDLTVLLSSIAGELEARLEGDLMVSASGGNMSLLGQMDIVDGKYFVYGQNFVVEKGELKFDRISAIDPKLDITAKTSIGQDEVYLQIGGTLSAPQLEFRSDNPDFTQEDILRLFAGISDSTVFIDALQQRTRALLERYLAHNLERVAQKTLGVDEFYITTASDSGYSNPSQLRLTVGKRLTSNLFLRYSQTLSESGQQSVELEYSLSRHISVQLIQTPDGYYKVKLNFKWRY